MTFPYQGGLYDFLTGFWNNAVPSTIGGSDDLNRAWLAAQAQRSQAAMQAAAQLGLGQQSNQLRFYEMMGGTDAAHPTDAAQKWRQELEATQAVQQQKLSQEYAQLMGYGVDAAGNLTGQRTLGGQQLENEATQAGLNRQQQLQLQQLQQQAQSALSAQEATQGLTRLGREQTFAGQESAAERNLRQALQSQQITSTEQQNEAERILRKQMQGEQLTQQEREFSRTHALQEAASRRQQAELAGYMDNGQLTEAARAARSAEAARTAQLSGYLDSGQLTEEGRATREQERTQRAALAAQLLAAPKDVFKAGAYFRNLRGSDPASMGLGGGGIAGFNSMTQRMMGTPGTATLEDVDAEIGGGGQSSLGQSVPGAGTMAQQAPPPVAEQIGAATGAPQQTTPRSTILGTGTAGAPAPPTETQPAPATSPNPDEQTAGMQPGGPTDSPEAQQALETLQQLGIAPPQQSQLAGGGGEARTTGEDKPRGGKRGGGRRRQAALRDEYRKLLGGQGGGIDNALTQGSDNAQANRLRLSELLGMAPNQGADAQMQDMRWRGDGAADIQRAAVMPGPNDLPSGVDPAAWRTQLLQQAQLGAQGGLMTGGINAADWQAAQGGLNGNVPLAGQGRSYGSSITRELPGGGMLASNDYVMRPQTVGMDQAAIAAGFDPTAAMKQRLSAMLGYQLPSNGSSEGLNRAYQAAQAQRGQAAQLGAQGPDQGLSSLLVGGQAPTQAPAATDQASEAGGGFGMGSAGGDANQATGSGMSTSDTDTDTDEEPEKQQFSDQGVAMGAAQGPAGPQGDPISALIAGGPGALGMGAGGSFPGRAEPDGIVPPNIPYLDPSVLQEPEVRAMVEDVRRQGARDGSDSQRVRGKKSRSSDPSGPDGANTGMPWATGEDRSNERQWSDERFLRGLSGLHRRGVLGAPGSQPGGPVDAPLWPTDGGTAQPELQSAQSLGAGSFAAPAAAAPAAPGIGSVDQGQQQAALDYMTDLLTKGVGNQDPQFLQKMSKTQRGLAEGALEALGLDQEDFEQSVAQTRFANVGNVLSA
jgi:hypothetical protein